MYLGLLDKDKKEISGSAILDGYIRKSAMDYNWGISLVDPRKEWSKNYHIQFINKNTISWEVGGYWPCAHFIGVYDEVIGGNIIIVQRLDKPSKPFQPGDLYSMGIGALVIATRIDTGEKIDD